MHVPDVGDIFAPDRCSPSHGRRMRRGGIVDSVSITALVTDVRNAIEAHDCTAALAALDELASHLADACTAAVRTHDAVTAAWRQISAASLALGDVVTAADDHRRLLRAWHADVIDRHLPPGHG
jgi:hypothetical protein